VISEGSFDTCGVWSSVAADNSALITEINYNLKYIKADKQWIIMRHFRWP